MKKKKLGVVGKLVGKNWIALTVFELFYKLALATIMLPLLSGSFDNIMKISGYAYLTLENVASFLCNPLTLLMLLIFFLLAATFSMVDISAVIYTLNQSYQGSKAHIWHIVLFAVRNALRIWKPQNYLLAVVVLILLPFLNAGTAAGVLSSFSLPEFIMDYIYANRALLILFYAAMLLLALLMMRWIYSFHYYTLEKCSFREAHRKSTVLSKKYMVGDFMTMLIVQLLFSVGYVLIFFLLVLFAIWVSRLLSGLFVLRWITGTAIWIAILVSLVIASALATPISYGTVSVLYYYHKEENGEAVVHLPAEENVDNPAHTRRLRTAYTIGGCFILIAALGLGYLLASGKINPQIEYVRTMEVTAHRGASAYYPENTMAAFRGAREMGADWVELDVQQTKDGHIIVIHDTNTKRTTGISANTWELTCDEIAKLDAGSFFSPRFAGEQIPLLTDVAAYAKESGLKLNIELKPTGHETDFEKCVVDIIRDYHLADDCVITSQVYKVLENVKTYDPEITTVYVMSLAYGDLTRLTAADHFSVEATSATKSLVSRIHNEGKQIYAWTVNTEKSINTMIDRNVDNIITDNITLARQCVEQSRYSDLLTEFIKQIK